MAQALDEHDRSDDDEDRDGFDEDPDESDQDSGHSAADDIGELVPCPFCKKLVHEDADLCPHCRNYVGDDDAPRRMPPYVWVGLVLAALCVLTWLVL